MGASGQADDADEGLESGDEDDVEFVMGDGGASSGGASLASGRAVPGSHNRTFLRDDGAAQEHTAIAMQKTVVDESKPSQYEMDIDQVEAKPWRNPGAKMSGKRKKGKKKRDHAFVSSVLFLFFSHNFLFFFFFKKRLV